MTIKIYIWKMHKWMQHWPRLPLLFIFPIILVTDCDLLLSELIGCHSLFFQFVIILCHSVCIPPLPPSPPLRPKKTFAVVKCSWEVCIISRAFHNNSLCKIWRANRGCYEELENTEYINFTVTCTVCKHITLPTVGMRTNLAWLSATVLEN